MQFAAVTDTSMPKKMKFW